MGIEHPILGLMTITIILTALVGAIVFLAIYHYNLQEAILSLPLTVGYAQCYSKIRDENITGIFVANNHRVSLYLTKVWIGTEEGPIEVPVSNGVGSKTFGNAMIKVWTSGFHEGSRLLQGQPGTVWVSIKSSTPLHLKGKTYSITLYFKVEGREAFITQEARVKPGETPSCSKIITITKDLVLSSRAAIYSDTFDTDPFGGGRLIKATCEWRYDSTRRTIQISADQRGPLSWGYWCVATINNIDISKHVRDGSTVYIAFLAFRSGFGTLPTFRVASLYIRADAPEFHIIGYEDRTLVGRTGDDVTSLIAYFIAQREVSVSRKPLGVTRTLEYWYLSHISTGINFSSWRAIHWINGTVEPNEANIPQIPNIGRAGIGFWINVGTSGTVYFDNLIVTVNRPPWIVEVGGLEPGWTVKLRNASGYVVATATAGSDGVARLIVAPPIIDLLSEPNNRNGFIFPNGIIEVYDEYGNLVVRRQFQMILGGDRYDLVVIIGMI